MKTLITTLSFGFIVCFVWTLTVVGQIPYPGAPDKLFGRRGVAITPPPSFNYFHHVSDVAFQQDGKIIVVGSLDSGYVWTVYPRFLVARYDQNGTLDPTFGVGGILTPDFGVGAGASSVAIQPDGKILVAGGMNNDLAIVRFNTDGTLDPTFGVNGITTSDFSFFRDISIEFPGSLRLLPDGEFIVATTRDIYGTNRRLVYPIRKILIAEYDANGNFEKQFESPLLPYQHSSMTGAPYQSADGSIFISGLGLDAIPAATIRVPFLIKYKPNGMVDTTFADNGVYVSSNYISGAIKELPDQSILVSEEHRLIRLDHSGTVASDIISGPHVVDGRPFDARGFLIQSDGKLLTTGFMTDTSEAVLVRYLPDGSLDTSFGMNGFVKQSAFGGLVVNGAGTFLQPDGKILQVTNTSVNPGQIVMARYYGDLQSMPDPFRSK